MNYYSRILLEHLRKATSWLSFYIYDDHSGRLIITSLHKFKKSAFLCCAVLSFLSPFSSPWYNSNGWLGIKHQVTPSLFSPGRTFFSLLSMSMFESFQHCSHLPLASQYCSSCFQYRNHLPLLSSCSCVCVRVCVCVSVHSSPCLLLSTWLLSAQQPPISWWKTVKVRLLWATLLACARTPCQKVTCPTRPPSAFSCCWQPLC